MEAGTLPGQEQVGAGVILPRGSMTLPRARPRSSKLSVKTLFVVGPGAVRVVAGPAAGGLAPTLGTKRPPALTLPGVASVVAPDQGPAMSQRISTASRSRSWR
ncbi:hypothetical protein GCM10010278_84550 [Streptomyces melanogenes]|nr:hypothetical protein GCM10010278_84550 [Streptomyces melanogenes]